MKTEVIISIIAVVVILAIIAYVVYKKDRFTVATPNTAPRIIYPDKKGYFRGDLAYGEVQQAPPTLTLTPAEYAANLKALEAADALGTVAAITAARQLSL